MQREQITDKESICLLIVFIFGSTLILGSGGAAKNDSWMTVIVGFIMAIPILLVYCRILSLFQNRNLFDILNMMFGKVVGKLISVLYVWYAFHLGALVLRNYGEFISTVALPETPMLVVLISMGSVCIFAVRLGLEVIGRTTTYFLPIIFFIIIVVQLLGIPQLHFEYLKPILGNGLIPVLKGGFSAFSFPFAEAVLFLFISGSLKTQKSSYKVFSWGMLISVIVIIGIAVRNIAVLGIMSESYYFQSYAAVSRINIGEFLQRIEITVAIVFVFSIFIKSSVCLLVACKGLQSIFDLRDYRSIAIQTGLLMVYFSYIIYDSSMEMEYWAFKVYSYYAFPFQVILPIFIWVFAEIKAKNIQ